MSKLTCKRCGATAEGKDFDECDSIIDHSIGLIKGWDCAGKPDDLIFSGEKAKVTQSTDKPLPPVKPLAKKKSK